MSEKYYTPEWEEFGIGFEYEEKNTGREDFYTTEIYSSSDMQDVAFELSVNHIRVKYLDRQDIEDLGWVFNCQIDGKSLENSVQVFLRNSGHYAMTKTGTHLRIDREVNGEDSDLIFDGNIKNKSELKRLMKQLNINI